MNGIYGSRVTEFGSDGVWSKIFCDFWVGGTAELSEGLDGVLLSDFEGDAGAGGHVLHHADELWEHALVHLEEFFGRWSVEGEHFHGRNFEALLQYHVDDLAGEALLDDVGLDDAASAIIECGGGGEGLRKEELGLALEVGAVGTSVAGVFLAVSAEEGTD